ncbi:hypothetical protein IAI10_13470 [Clostridium sp. 19966]|nr:hypothetical protein [Clostridium sp. 19966]
MKLLNSKSYEEVRVWMHRNARPLELAIWKYTFEKGSKEEVLSELAFYQNSDGGFGNALEADNWNSESSPYTTLFAINILKLINFMDIKHPIIQGIFKFLESGKYFGECGWFFSIPSNNEYPHAPWRTYDGKANETESIGVTAELASFIMKFFDKNTELYKRALAVSQRIIENLKTSTNHGDMGIEGYCVLLDTIKQINLENKLDYEFLLEFVKNLVFTSIERDTSKWSFYGVRPSNYITSPDNIFYKDNKDIVQKELDYLIETRAKNDVWGITWSWFENNEKYAKEFAISENWWKGFKAIEKMTFLRNFGRLT